MDIFALGIAWYLVFVVSAMFHEAAHAFTAMKFIWQSKRQNLSG